MKDINHNNMIPEDQSYILRMTSGGEEVVSARRALKRCASYMEDAEPCTATRTPSRIWRRKLSSSHHDNIDEEEVEEEDEHIVVDSSLIHSSKRINDYFSEYTLPCYYDSDDEVRQEGMPTTPSRFPSLLKATSFIDPEDDDSEERTRQEEHIHDEHERHVFDFTDARDDYETMLFPEASHKEEDEVDTEDDEDDDDLAPWLIIKERSCCSRPTILSSSIPSSDDNKTRLLFLHDRVDVGNEYQERDVHGI